MRDLIDSTAYPGADMLLTRPKWMNQRARTKYSIWHRNRSTASYLFLPQSHRFMMAKLTQNYHIIGNDSDASSSSEQPTHSARTSLNMADSDVEEDGHSQQTVSIYDVETDEEATQESDINRSQAPATIFEGKSFHFCGNIGAVDEIKLRRVVDDHGGSICARATDADYVISKEAYDGGDNNLKGCVVKPLWVYESSDMNRLLPINRYKL